MLTGCIGQFAIFLSRSDPTYQEVNTSPDENIHTYDRETIATDVKHYPVAFISQETGRV